MPERQQDQHIGGYIRSLRESRGLTLDELAGPASISASHLSRIERQLTLPSFKVVASLADVLGLSVDDLVAMDRNTRVINVLLETQLADMGLGMEARSDILSLPVPTRTELLNTLQEAFPEFHPAEIEVG